MWHVELCSPNPFMFQGKGPLEDKHPLAQPFICFGLEDRVTGMSAWRS